jgi:transposase
LRLPSYNLFLFSIGMSRYDLTDFEWRMIEPLLPNKPRGVPRVDDRRTLNGIFWVLRSGAPWRDLPERYGPRTTCYNRFNRWRQSGVNEARTYLMSFCRLVVLMLETLRRANAAGMLIRFRPDLEQKISEYASLVDTYREWLGDEIGRSANATSATSPL